MMKELSDRYTCDHTEGDYLDVDDDFDGDGINLNIYEGGSHAAVALRRDKAVELAWTLLEYFEVAKRPEPEWKVGDYIVVQRASSTLCGLLGRVVDVRDTAGYISLAVTDLAGERHWVSASDAKRLTPAEFRTRVNTRIAEIMREF